MDFILSAAEHPVSPTDLAELQRIMARKVHEQIGLRKKRTITVSLPMTTSQFLQSAWTFSDLVKLDLSTRITPQGSFYRDEEERKDKDWTTEERLEYFTHRIELQFSQPEHLPPLLSFLEEEYPNSLDEHTYIKWRNPEQQQEAKAFEKKKSAKEKDSCLRQGRRYKRYNRLPTSVTLTYNFELNTLIFKADYAQLNWYGHQI